jgi:hypothetical protein
MKKVVVAFALTFLALACNATYVVDVRAPYCPVSDSAKAKADSVSSLCLIPRDSVQR